MRCIPRRFRGAVVAAALLLSGASSARAALVLLDQFNPNLGQLVASAYDPLTESVWVYGGLGANLSSYTRTGAFVSSTPRPGEAADDFDLEFPSEPLTLGVTAVPAGSLLVINGEAGVAEVYAVNPSTGAVIATLTTAFGASHVVGGAYHAGRDTLFLIADQFDATPSTVAEINPLTGAVLNTFGTTGTDYIINFGDIEIDPSTGNLLLVSSLESAIRELTPTGAFVQDMALPAGVSSLSGIALDEARGELWVSSTGGNVFRLGGLAAVPEPQTIVMLTGAALGLWMRCRR